jgi:protein transport protein SEC61 subunit gamma-like protein
MAKKKETPSSKPKQRESSKSDTKQRAPVQKPAKSQDAPKTTARLSRKAIEQKIGEYRRILTLTKRPTREEFSTIAKVAAIGIVIIGVAGFLIYLAMVQAPQSISNATKATASPTVSNIENASAVINTTAGNASLAINNTVSNTTAP